MFHYISRVVNRGADGMAKLRVLEALEINTFMEPPDEVFQLVREEREESGTVEGNAQGYS